MKQYQYRDDSCFTGWVAPDGEFWGCESYDHLNMMQVDMGIKDENELENRGWIKIYRDPMAFEPKIYGNTAVWLRLNDKLDYFAYRVGTPTFKQIQVLKAKGVEIHKHEEYIC